MVHLTEAGIRASRSSRSGRHERPAGRRFVALMATIALAFGVSVVSASPATAAPGDPIVFADQNLEDAINDELARPHGTPVTEGDAATLTDLDAGSAGIVDLTGIEHLTGLTTLYLGGNGITDLSALSGLTALTDLNLSSNSAADISALSGLTNLTHLYLSGNGIADVSALSGLTQMRVLYLSNNSVTDVSPLTDLTDLVHLTLANNRVADVSPLASLTDLTHLHLRYNEITEVTGLSALTQLATLDLRDNRITDVSPLSSLTDLSNLYLEGQSVDVPSAAVGASTANPVVDVAGDPVPLDSSDPGFTYDPSAHAWTFSTTGTKALAWDVPVAIGTVTDAAFSGEMSQAIRQPSLVPATPQDPVVIQGVCASGEVVGPQVDLPTTGGIDYAIEGDIEPGATITVRATPADDDHSIVADPDSDWIGNSDRLYATLEVTLEAVECDMPPASGGDDPQTSGVPLPVADGDGSQPIIGEGTLPRTGASQSMILLGALGALMVVTGTAFVTTRRRLATR